MSNLSPLFAVIIFLIAYFTAYTINLKYKVYTLSDRYETVDGLRGFLAISVFIAHASLWFNYIQKEQWDHGSRLYSQLGSTSVAFFFMISSFLFVSKLLNLGERNFNWKSFFISRLFRLVPMYYFSVTIIILLTLIITGWRLKVGIMQFFHELFLWGTFTIVDDSTINGYGLTPLINAGVVWSLPFEWLFYFSLPIISLFIIKKKPPVFYLFISFIFISGYFYVNPVRVAHLFSFVGGILAAVCVKYKPLENKDNIIFSILILICLALIVQFENSTNIICKILIIIVFILVSSGNTLFGILKNTTLKLLGEISYSTYLIHGIVLFVVFYFGFGLEKSKTLSSSEFCIVIFLITPIIVILSFVCYRFIEKPFIKISKKFK